MHPDHVIRRHILSNSCVIVVSYFHGKEGSMILHVGWRHRYATSTGLEVDFRTFVLCMHIVMIKRFYGNCMTGISTWKYFLIIDQHTN